jgi:Arc/MetJ-type ribon-helix-helix transcriptional regulator
MRSLTVKIPAPLQGKLDAEARKSRKSKSELVREALERLLKEPAGRGPSAHDLLKDLQGKPKRGTPSDLSTNPRHFEGYGE